MNIWEKLLIIQENLKAPKSLRNSFANFNYRSLEGILEAVKPLLIEQKLSLTITDKPICVGDRVYIEATAILSDIKDPLTSIISTASAREALTKKGMDDSQITGSTSSYARKYCLNGLFLIDDTKDADSMDNSKKPAKNKPKPDLFLDTMQGYAKNESKVYWAVLGSNGFEKATDVPSDQKTKILKEMSDKLKEK